MRVVAIAIFGLTLSVAADAPALAAQTPQARWKSVLAEANADYATKPHAILKIQDGAYLGEGENASLTGAKGKPDSYKWTKGQIPGAVLSAGYRNGRLWIRNDGHAPVDDVIGKSIPVDHDVDIQAERTQVAAGVEGVRIFLYNQQSAAAHAFKGLDYFPYDPAYRIVARFVPDAKLPPRIFRTSRGTDKQFYHTGDAHFVLHGKSITLAFYAESGTPKKITGMSAFFTDDLTGKETYGAGRYVDAETFGAFPPKDITIDFNFAYNPNCARSAFFTCPVARDNLATAIKAGERDPHKTH